MPGNGNGNGEEIIRAGGIPFTEPPKADSAEDDEPKE